MWNIASGVVRVWRSMLKGSHRRSWLARPVRPRSPGGPGRCSYEMSSFKLFISLPGQCPLATTSFFLLRWIPFLSKVAREQRLSHFHEPNTIVPRSLSSNPVMLLKVQQEATLSSLTVADCLEHDCALRRRRSPGRILIAGRGLRLSLEGRPESGLEQ